MTETKSKNNKLIYCIIAAVVLVGVGIAVFLLTRGKVINDDFFVSNDSKLVLTMEDNSYGAKKSHAVVYINGEKITGSETYVEFENEKDAKDAYEALKNDVEGIQLNGKYIVKSEDVSEFEGTSASELKAMFEFINNGYDSMVDTDVVEEGSNYEEIVEKAE